MSLLPIIYTSLLITAGLLIFVVLVSYISYRVKKSGRNRISSFRKQNQNVAIAVRSAPQPIQQRPTQLASPRQREQIRKSKPAPVENAPAHRVSNYKHSITQRPIRSDQKTRTKRFDVEKVATNLHETKPDFMKKSAAGKLKNRIEVVNPIQNSDTSIEKLNRRETLALTTKKLNGNNILDYYDDEGTDYFTLRSAGQTS